MTSPQLRIDRSRDFSTVHGERAHDDPHVNVHFFQDGLPFDAPGFLIPHLVTDGNLKALVERRLKKLASSARDAEATAGASLPDEDGPAPDKTGSDVNLEGWLRGDAYPWASVQRAIATRFSQRVSRMSDAVSLLVEDEKIIPEADVSARLMSLLKS